MNLLPPRSPKLKKMGNVFKKGHVKSEIRQDFEKAYNFLYQRKNSLDEYLKELDDLKKVECQSLCNHDIAQQAESYVKKILLMVEQQDPRFKSTFLRSGSFYDEVKIGFPDEFDFMAKLELLSKPDILEVLPTKLGFVQLVMKDSESIELWKDFLVEDTNSKEEEICNVVSIRILSDIFHELVHDAMKSTPNPPQWRRSPWPLRHGPCAKLEFLVDGFRETDPLEISIDLAICITYPNYQSVQFPFYKYLDDKSLCTSFLAEKMSDDAEVLLVPFTYDSVQQTFPGSSSWIYNYREQMRVSFSMLEQAIFSQFAKDSIEKRLIRVLKILRDAHLRDDGAIEDWEKRPNLPEGAFPDEPPSTIVRTNQV